MPLLLSTINLPCRLSTINLPSRLSTINLQSRLNTFNNLLINFIRIKSSLTSSSSLKDVMEGNWMESHHHNQLIQEEKMMNICMRISNKSHNRLLIKLKIQSHLQFCKIKQDLLMQIYQRT